MRKKLSFKDLFNNNGFTLIEVITVLAIIGIMTVVMAPFLSNYFGPQRSQFIIVESVIAKTFDDSFIHKRTNFLAIHLHSPLSDDSEEEENQPVFSRQNGISVVTMGNDGIFVDSKNKMLSPRTFSDSFKIEEVLLSNGEKISEGTVLVPFYADGFSDNVIIHILASNDIKKSIVINKMQKNPMKLNDYVNFQDIWKSYNDEE